MEEIWKDVPEWEDFYQISNMGRVRSKGGRVGSRIPRIIQPQINWDGYSSFRVSKNKIRKKINLHRAVAKVFIPNPDNKPQVNHKDRNRSNNKAENLEWVTASENIRDAMAKGWNPGLWSKSHSPLTSKLITLGYPVYYGINSTPQGKAIWMKCRYLAKKLGQI